jgi:hypothetical protein
MWTVVLIFAKHIISNKGVLKCSGIARCSDPEVF